MWTGFICLRWHPAVDFVPYMMENFFTSWANVSPWRRVLLRTVKYFDGFYFDLRSI